MMHEACKLIMGMNNYWINVVILTIVLFLTHITKGFTSYKGLAFRDDCGGFMHVADPIHEKGFLSSPEYPDYYPHMSNCIWLFETTRGYQLRMTITEVTLQGHAACTDSLEIRDGNSTADLLFFSCNTSRTVTVVSSARWLWIRFISDGKFNDKGFYANWSAVYAGSSMWNASKPFHECHNYELSCANMECTNSTSRCNGVNDCGCFENCDEYNCHGLPLPRGAMLGIGIGVGIIGFIIIFVILLALDRHKHKLPWGQIKKTEEDEDEDTEKAKSELL